MAPTFHTLSANFETSRCRLVGDYPQNLQSVLSLAAGREALSEITSWPGYVATPLAVLEPLAGSLGIATLNYKDEGGRFGLGSFKALGGAYAVFRLLADAVAERTGTRPTSAELTLGKYAEITHSITVTCGTEGNHGRSVAWGATTSRS